MPRSLFVRQARFCAMEQPRIARGLRALGLEHLLDVAFVDPPS